MKTINGIWKANTEEKASVATIVLCAISDQLEKRDDLHRPLRIQMVDMSPIFRLPDSKVPSYLVCRFMLLYSYMAYPKSLDIFLPFLQLDPVYSITLQCCFKVMSRYFSKYPDFNPYINSLAATILLSSSHLTPLLETTITTGEISYDLQYRIMEKLVLWMEAGLSKNNRQVGNKMSNLIAILINRMKVEDYNQEQEAVFGYIVSFVKCMARKENQEYEQFIV